MFHKDFYHKCRITYLDVILPNESKQQLNDLLEEFSDFMSKNSTDICLTHLEMMVLPTKPAATPVASNPNHMIYPLNITNLSKKKLTNLLEAGIIERSLSPYAAPIIVLLHKHNQGVFN